MSSASPSLAGTRQLLSPILGEDRACNLAPLGHGAADAALRGGLMRGALHEVFAGDPSGAGFGFAAALARRAAGPKRMLWIVQDFSALEHGQVSATGLAEFGIDPADVLMMRAANATDALRACADALSCGALGAVIAEVPGAPRILDLVASRRLVLGAQAKGVTALLLRSEAQIEPSAAQTRWLVRSARSQAGDDWGQPRFDAELTRNRRGETGRWTMEWCGDDGAFTEHAGQSAAHPGAVVSQAADRSAQTPPQRVSRTG
jgi:protein ImuA